MKGEVEKLTRRFDPERRERIIDAAIELAKDSGIANLTLRQVAQKADVPLGSVSYHFTDKDELITAVVHKARESNRDMTRQAIESGMKSGTLTSAFALLIETLTVHDHERLVLDHDLYLASMFNPKLQAESRGWSEDFLDTVGQYTDPVTAKALTFMFDGICLQSALFGYEFKKADVTPLIDRILEK